MNKRISLILVFTLIFQMLLITLIESGGIGYNGHIPAGGTPGRDGGYLETPSFRVGIISESMRSGNELKDQNNARLIEQQLKKHYVNHFPKLENSIIFTPASLGAPNGNIGWYQASTGSLQLINMPDSSKKHRSISKSNTRSSNVFVNALYSEIENDSKYLSDLSNGKWKQIGNSIDPNGTESAKVWNYILSDWQIAHSMYDRLHKYTNYTENASITEMELKRSQLGYLDLLMTLYYISPDNQRVAYEKAIERYITGDNLDVQPVIVAIDTVTCLDIPSIQNYLTGYLYVPSIDYVMYVTGTAPEYHFANPTAPTFTNNDTQSYVSGHTKKVIGSLVDKSITLLPNRPRLSNLRGDAKKSNGFAWGVSGAIGYVIQTDSGHTVWVDSSVDIGIMETITFTDDFYGFMIVFPGNAFKRPPTGGFDINSDDEGNNILEAGSGVIGAMPKIALTQNFTSNEKNKWNNELKNYTGGGGFPKIKIDMQVKHKINEGAEQSLDINSKYPLNTDTAYGCNKDWIYMSVEDLKKFINGDLTIDYLHDLMNYTVEEKDTVIFNYSAAVQVKLYEDKAPITLTAKDGLAQIIYFNPPKPPEPVYRTYTSEPEFWSEIKQGTPNNETFDAMAGVPTTRNLYFATGGSEFIVDIVTRYYENETATRTYKSYYSGTECEYKQGDTAPNQTLGGQSANLHNGGTYTKTWTGSIPNNATAVTALHSAACAAVPDYSAYNAALAEANAFAAQVNATTLSFTSASDKLTRSKTGWGASVSPSPNPPQSTSASASCTYRAPSGDPPSGGSPCSNEMATANPGPAGSYTITVTWTVPAHCICGPCCRHDLPAIEDKWQQTINYDIQKIEQVSIWKIHRSKINGMISLIGTDEVTANIVAGNPTVFSNIATAEDSRHGRLRYSLEPTQHDAVEWNEGTRTPHCNKQNEAWGDGILYTNPSFSTIENYHQLNSTTKDKATEEFNKFNERRTTDNKATVISDFVILQTSTGDQSVLYFDKDSVIKDSQQNFDKVVNTVEEMWDNNSESAGNWEPNEINLGCYNGKYYNTSTKYEGSGDNHRTDTVLDNDPANTISRPARPTADLRLMNTAIDIINTAPNGEYILGESRVFYTNVLTYKSPTYSNGLSGLYYDVYIPYFGAAGLDFGTTYSDNHSKINDIVVHNPVSAQFAMVLPVDSSRDQRTPSSQLIGGNLQSDIQEYVTRLKDTHPYQNFIYNGDARELNDAGELINWKKTGSAVFTAPSQQFKIQTTASTTAGYYTEATAVPNRAYVFSAELANSGGSGRIVVEELDSRGVVLQTRYFTGGSLNFTTNAATVKFIITIQKYSSAGILTADNLVLRFANGSTAEWVPMSYSSYQEATVANPSYVPAHQIPNPAYVPPVDIPGEQADFNYTGNYQTYIIPRDGTYIFEAWGAQGGNYYGGTGGYGTYVKETKTMTAGQTIYVYVGGQGYAGNSSQGGFNGGGRAGDCDCGSSSGGGATDFRYNGTSVSNRFVVAGGGGGVGTPGNNGRSSISIGTSNNIGQTGASSDGGGGGGGYRGGYNGGTDQGAYAGSAYVNGAERTSDYNDNNNFIVTTGKRSGNGFARITAPAVKTPGNGEPQYLNIPEQGSPTITAKVEITKVLSQPPDDWYETVLITIPANPNVTLPGVGSVTAANFLNLDYRFQIYFPNRGDFYGNGAYGISNTTSNRGKGFINNMPTTEYTAQKIVKFDFNVIYNGVLYRAREEINLPVNQEIYDFYLPLANKEAVSASAEFIAIAINGDVLDNTLPTNKIRYTNLDARHSAYKMYNIDIVGRIGNLLIEDTGDFRFSNFFKLPVIPTRWFIENIVRDVESDQQNNIMGTRTDIRGETVNAATDYLNTYGTLDFMQKAPYVFPLNPDINPIQALRKQPLRIGYPIMMDIQTIGNYYSNMQIIPYYYCLNLKTGDITPVDVYMNVNTIYRPINLFGAAVPGWNPASVYNYQIMLNWEEEAARRNYHVEEQAITEYVRDSTYNADSNGNEIPIGIPMGKYHAYGNAQIMYPNERNRTFIGSSNTYGAETNPGNVLTEYEYNQQGQRWHFTFKLPSSAVFVPKDQQVTQTNIDKVMNENCVILLAADIKSIGDTYVLQYNHTNISINIAGTTHNLNTIPYPVLAIYSSNKSSSNDLTTTGTH